MVMCCSSAVNRTPLLSRAAWRTASSRLDAMPRLGVRTAVAWPPFPLGQALPSTISAKDKSSLFDRFAGTTTSSESSSACMLIYGLRLHEPVRPAKPGTDEASQDPYKGRLHVP